MYYAQQLRGLSQITPGGKDCADIKRLFERESRLAKTRSKKHRPRHKKNAARLEKSYQECQTRASEVIPPSAGGERPPTPEELILEDTAQQPINYSKLAGIVAGISCRNNNNATLIPHILGCIDDGRAG